MSFFYNNREYKLDEMEQIESIEDDNGNIRARYVIKGLADSPVFVDNKIIAGRVPDNYNPSFDGYAGYTIDANAMNFALGSNSQYYNTYFDGYAMNFTLGSSSQYYNYCTNAFDNNPFFLRDDFYNYDNIFKSLIDVLPEEQLLKLKNIIEAKLTERNE